MADSKKKVALLNMRFDGNYGGNLQRYAMVSTLRRMGYDVEYLYIRDNWGDWFEHRSLSKIVKLTIKQAIRHIRNPKEEPWLAWHREADNYREECKTAEPFLDKYIPHTRPIYSHGALTRIFKNGRYNAIVAGSDQIWRKKFVERYGLGTWFVDFLPFDFQGARVIYGASFGVDDVEYTQDEISKIRPLFERLSAVSIRETSGLGLLSRYAWTKPKAEVVLDPTLLLAKDDYIALIENADTNEADGDMFCYVLDMTPEIDEQIGRMAQEKGLRPYVMGLVSNRQVSVEQWLRYIRDTKFVFTDSYHGLLFALIFGKPFYLSYNGFRGNARFDSIFNLLGTNPAEPDFSQITARLRQLRSSSIAFLQNALKE